jgi:hypothetical protein
MNGAQFIGTLPTLARGYQWFSRVGFEACEALPGPLLEKPFGAPELRRIFYQALDSRSKLW